MTVDKDGYVGKTGKEVIVSRKEPRSSLPSFFRKLLTSKMDREMLPCFI